MRSQKAMVKIKSVEKYSAKKITGILSTKNKLP